MILTPEEESKRNEAIARYMGYKIWFKNGNNIIIEISPGTTTPINGWAKYHSSWDWLMPVVEKIEAQGCRTEIRGTETFGGDNLYQCEILKFDQDTPVLRRESKSSKIEAVFLAVSDYCIALNKTIKK